MAMVLEIIFTWLGGILLITFVAFLIVMTLYYIKSYFLDIRIGFKALFWHLVSEVYELKNIDNSAVRQMRMTEETTWYIKYKNKRYTWKCVKVEDLNDTVGRKNVI